MRIGIDISQTAFKNTGVSNYLSNLVINLLNKDTKNDYVLFFSSFRSSINPELRLNLKDIMEKNKNVKLKKFLFPPALLNLLWNRLHMLPIESFTGPLDLFITSDWTEPLAKKARKASILYDLIVYKYPEETHNKTEFNLKSFLISPNIVDSQIRKHKWMKEEASIIFCISESTKKDAIEILKIPEDKLFVIYPGINL